jgi:hypothetical protein
MGHVDPETTLSYADAIDCETARQYHVAMERIHGDVVALRGAVRPVEMVRAHSEARLDSPSSGRSLRKASGPKAHSRRESAA